MDFVTKVLEFDLLCIDNAVIASDIMGLSGIILPACSGGECRRGSRL